MDQKIVIIGAGVSGLVAALHCEKAGYKPIIIEASERVGGRIKTDQKDGFLLDQGFQVLLSAYQEAKRYLDLEALDLRSFSTGAHIFDGNKRSIMIGCRERFEMQQIVSFTKQPFTYTLGIYVETNLKVIETAISKAFVIGIMPWPQGRL